MLQGRFMLFLSIVFAATAILPGPVAHAALWGPGDFLVPCGNAPTVYEDGNKICYVYGGDAGECTYCDLVALAHNILNLLVFLAVVVAALLFVYAGVLYLGASANSSNVSKAHRVLMNTTIGLIIILAAWLFIDVVMKTLYGEDGSGAWGPWNEILCENTNPEATCIETREGLSMLGTVQTPTTGTTTLTWPGGPVIVGPGPLNAAYIAAAMKNTEKYMDALTQYAQQNGISPELARSIMMAESAGINRRVSSAGAGGLMQIMPGTARGLDPALNGLTDAQVRERLNDPNYNMQLGTKYLGQLSRQFGGDPTLISAAYNGGPGAAQPSTSCPGLRVYQCTAVRNNYGETRTYVQKIAQLNAAQP